MATVAIFGLVVTAGVFGPTASEVAQAEAVITVKRAIARFAVNLDCIKIALNRAVFILLRLWYNKRVRIEINYISRYNLIRSAIKNASIFIALTHIDYEKNIFSNCNCWSDWHSYLGCKIQRAGWP
ncbi:hypothetical protein KKF64_01910 [Patescibacteria group bacterium]|nr:hypothetical protein [Patescibacteria group bacterium]